MLRTLYRLLRILGDVRAASRGRLPQRLIRRQAHRQLNQGMRKVGL